MVIDVTKAALLPFTRNGLHWLFTIRGLGTSENGPKGEGHWQARGGGRIKGSVLHQEGHLIVSLVTFQN